MHANGNQYRIDNNTQWIFAQEWKYRVKISNFSHFPIRLSFFWPEKTNRTWKKHLEIENILYAVRSTHTRSQRRTADYMREWEQIAHERYIWFDRTSYKLINHGANKISKIFCSSCTTFQRKHYYKNYCTRTPGIPIVFVFHFHFYFSLPSSFSWRHSVCVAGCLFLFRPAFYIESGRNSATNCAQSLTRCVFVPVRPPY